MRNIKAKPLGWKHVSSVFKPVFPSILFSNSPVEIMPQFLYSYVRHSF
jgi:hypothetical protein